MTEPKPPLSQSDLHSRRRQAIIGAAVMAVLAVVQIGMLVSSYVRNAPLRGDGLVSTQAVVTDFDHNRRSSDEVSVTYDVEGQGEQQADIPVSRSFDTGDAVEVQYAPDDTALVRTVDDWAPNYRNPILLILAAFAVVLLAIFSVGIVRPSTIPRDSGDRTRAAGGVLGHPGIRFVILGGAVLIGIVLGFAR